MVPPVDMEVMLEEAKDKKLHKTIDINIVKMVGFPLGKSDDLLRKTIRDAIREVGQTQFPDSYVESWVRLVKRPKYYSRLILEKDCHKCVKVLGPDMDMFDACCICQEGFFLGGYATITSCSHVFHSSCITDWINKSTKCPLCRVQLEFGLNFLIPIAYCLLRRKGNNDINKSTSFVCWTDLSGQG
ncbi:hypothetical protein YC2023_079775 [Brassica napus]